MCLLRVFFIYFFLFKTFCAYTLCPEKRDQNVFRNIFYETWAITMKFST